MALVVVLGLGISSVITSGMKQQRGIQAIEAGGGQICALLVSDGVKCWGNSTNGQLGNGSTTGSNFPVKVLL